jgi:hypothetical protein
MNKKWFLLGLLIVFIPGASADTFQGYYNSLGNGFPLTDTWFTQTVCVSSCLWASGAGGITNTGTGTADGVRICVVAPTCAPVGHALPVPTGDWSFQVSYTVSRTVNTPPVCGGITITNVGGTNNLQGASNDWFTNTAGSPTGTSCNSHYVDGGCFVPTTPLATGAGTSSSGTFIISFTRATHTESVRSGNGVSCTHVLASTGESYADQWQMSAQSICESRQSTQTPPGSCAVSFSNMIYNINDGHTFNLTVAATVNQPAEFDSGLKAFFIGLGFITPESQFLVCLLLIALATIGAAFITSFMGEGPGRNWIIFGTGCLVGIFCVLLSFVPLWEYILSLVLGTVAVRGGTEFINTFKNLASFRKREPVEPSAPIAVETHSLVNEEVKISQPDSEPT